MIGVDDGDSGHYLFVYVAIVNKTPHFLPSQPRGQGAATEQTCLGVQRGHVDIGKPHPFDWTVLAPVIDAHVMHFDVETAAVHYL